MKMTLLGGMIAGSTLIASVAQAEDTLTAVHAFPETLIYTKSFLSFVDKVNEAGAGVVQIEVRGGPEAIGMFQQPDAVRDGIVDMVYTPGSFYGGALPEKDAMVASNLTAVETRMNGGTELMDQIDGIGATPILMTPTMFDHHQYDMRKSDPDYRFARGRAEALVMAAIDYSIEKHVVHVAAKAPGEALRRYAAAQKKRLQHIPLAALSPVTIKKVRVLHVLAGHDKRSVAPKYVW